MILKLFFIFSVCDMKCGEWGCLKGSQLCCHKECLGGCFAYLNSARHCYACRHLRMPDGECVERCPSPFYEVQIKVFEDFVIFGYSVREFSSLWKWTTEFTIPSILCCACTALATSLLFTPPCFSFSQQSFSKWSLINKLDFEY